MLNGNIDRSRYLIKNFEDEPYIIDEKKILKVCEFRNQIHLKQIIDLGITEIPKSFQFDRFGGINLNIDNEELKFLEETYTEFKIRQMTLGRQNFSKLTDLRRKIIINDKDGKSFFVFDIKKN